MRLALFTALALALPAVPAIAQSIGDSKAGSSGSMQMHRDMMKGAKESMSMKPSGDMDQDFVKMMRHHHENGMRMAKHEAQNGKDPEVRELAKKILESQRQEAKQLDRLAKSKTGNSSDGSTGASK